MQPPKKDFTVMLNLFFVFLELSVNCYLMVFHACIIQFIEKQASLSA